MPHSVAHMRSGRRIASDEAWKHSLQLSYQCQSRLVALKSVADLEYLCDHVPVGSR